MMMESPNLVTLEPAKPEDAENLAQLQKEAFRRLYAQYHDEKSPFLKGPEEILRWLAREDIDYWKIFWQGQLCGGIAYHKKEPGCYYLARLYIAPQFQHHGIASKAITLCEALLPEARQFSLDFPVDQPANRHCYEKCGYCDTGIRERVNERLTLAIFEKQIL